MTRRSYRMTGRAKDQDEMRDRIVRATIALHDEQGVAATSYVDVAKRAGIGAATVYRHFPTLGSLVMACGAHVWAEMDPPVPERAAGIFGGIDRPEDRLLRLVEELDSFYRRGAHRLAGASADRHRVPELDGFLQAVERGVEALVREAVRDAAVPETAIQLLLALTDFPVWLSMQRIEGDDRDRQRLLARVLTSALRQDRQAARDVSQSPVDRGPAAAGPDREAD